MTWQRTSAFLLTLLLGLSATAQQLDSLLAVWRDPQRPDSLRVVAYRDYIWDGFLFTDPDSAIRLAGALHAFAREHGYPRADAHGHHVKGTAHFINGDYRAAVDEYERSLRVSEELNDLKGIAASLGNLGNVYSELGDHRRAQECAERSLEIEIRVGNQDGIAHSLNNLGSMHLNRGDYLRALDLFERSLAIREKMQDQVGIAYGLVNIGNIHHMQGDQRKALDYYERSRVLFEVSAYPLGIATSLNRMGNAHVTLHDYAVALAFFQQALTIRQEIGERMGMAEALVSMADLYREQGEYAHAEEHYAQALMLANEIAHQWYVAQCHVGMGIVHLDQGRTSDAIRSCRMALATAEELSALDLKKTACKCLYDGYKTMGNGSEALVYLERMKAVEDSLQAEETTRELERMEFAKLMLVDSIAKAEEARLVEEAHREEIRTKNRTRNYLAVSGLALLLVAVGLYSRSRYMRRSRDLISKERDRSENLLLNILPAEVAAELKEKGRAEAREYAQVSILFTDFKGFTEASARLIAGDLVNEINTCFEAFDRIVEQHGIEKIKTIGDAYMAAGGLPVPTDGATQRTVLAALDMQDFITRRHAERAAHGLPAFEMRVGIHTGPVVAGIVGVKKFQYDIWGDTVNTASRMESSGEVGQVNISEATYALVKQEPGLTFTPRGKVQAKGKGEMEMYFVNRSLGEG